MSEMEVFVHETAGYISLILDAIAVLMVAVGAIRALIEMLPTSVRRQATGPHVRNVFIDFARSDFGRRDDASVSIDKGAVTGSY
jgi:hypothetical protein